MATERHLPLYSRGVPVPGAAGVRPTPRTGDEAPDTGDARDERRHLREQSMTAAAG